MRKLLVILPLVALTACTVTGGRMIDKTRIGDIENGQDKTTITAWFGQPYSIKNNLKDHPRGCSERWVYSYAKGVGFGVVESEDLFVDFDDTGLVCDRKYTRYK